MVPKPGMVMAVMPAAVFLKHVESPANHQQRQGRIQAATDADDDVFGAGVFEAASQPG